VSVTAEIGSPAEGNRLEPKFSVYLKRTKRFSECYGVADTIPRTDEVDVRGCNGIDASCRGQHAVCIRCL